MGDRILRAIFYGNYFVGILAVVLTIESTLQLGNPFSIWAYYVLIFFVPIFYYTYAYMGVTGIEVKTNPRTLWYVRHAGQMRISQWFSGTAAFVAIVFLVSVYFSQLSRLPLGYWAALIVIALLAFLYYGMIPLFQLRINLRNTALLKPFVIGFVWAATVNFLPLVMLKIESPAKFDVSSLWYFLFLKNWMFCTVNAIMFDIKDYAVDYNNQLKTFVVRIGLRKTVNFILIPLLLTGMLSLILFAIFRDFPIGRVLINLLPFILTILVAYTLNHRKQIFYYLLVIDGLILLKALCGIAGMLWFRN